MTTEMHKADGVHRLVDMVVEEVSLVDRAANKHRFLIVKRDEAMDDDKTQNTTPAEPSPPAAPTAKLDDNSALNAALAALESLTGLVELLGDLGADQADARPCKHGQPRGCGVGCGGASRPARTGRRRIRRDDR